MKFPQAVDPSKVGTYPALSKSGGGRFYDDVLEYRVWVHPLGKDVYFHAFLTYEEALVFSKSTENAETPLVLGYQEEYINESEPNNFIHAKESRITEWKPEWLKDAHGTKKHILQLLNDRRSK